MSYQNLDTERVLTLSTSHMPCDEPDFGDVRHVEHEYGFILFTSDHYAEDDVPEWLREIMRAARDCDCTLINFDRDTGVFDGIFPTYDW